MPVAQPRSSIGTFAPIADEPMSKQVIGVRVPIRIEVALKELPNRSEWLRQVIVYAVETQLLGNDHHRGCGPNETPAIELEPILKELEAAFNSGKTLKPTDIKQLLERLRSINVS